jgi:hypothetical protein
VAELNKKKDEGIKLAVAQGTYTVKKKEENKLYEKDFLVPTTDLVRIYDDAFLGMLTLPLGSLAATVLRGDLKVIWS